MANIHRKISIRGLTDAWSYRSVSCRTRSGKTILVEKPLVKLTQTEAQIRKNPLPAILRATTYAHFVGTNDVYLDREVETGVCAYTLALAHWFSAPRLLKIDLDRWTGQPGQIIGIKARDSIKVAVVLLVIRDAQGDVLESGEAVPSPAGADWWTYTTTTSVSLTPFPSLEAIVRNLPGNKDSFMI